MEQVDTKKLAKVLGISLSTLTVWSHRLGNSKRPNLPQLVELRPDSCQPTQLNRPEGLNKRLVVEISDTQGKQLRLELPYEPFSMQKHPSRQEQTGWVEKIAMAIAL